MRFPACLIAGLLAAAPVALAAQDSLPDPRRAERLRQQIEERFGDRLKEELGLSDEQAAKLKASLTANAARRRGMEQEERRLRAALAGQLRPGVAANADSVNKLVDALTNHRVAYAQTFRDEMRELATVLNPVQRGQYLMLRDRLMQRAQAIREARAGDGPPMAGPLRRRPLRP